MKLSIWKGSITNALYISEDTDDRIKIYAMLSIKKGLLIDSDAIGNNTDYIRKI